jgi:hypothetical protein
VESNAIGRLIDGHYWLKASSDFEGYDLGFFGGCKGGKLGLPFIFFTILIFFGLLLHIKPPVCFLNNLN